MVDGKCNTGEWKDNFRLSHDEFFDLCNELAPHISPDSRSPNPKMVDAPKKLAITLYYLKDQGSIRMTANQFGVAMCTAAKVVHQVCSVIVTYMGPNLIRMPATEDEMREAVSKFECTHGMKQAFGCIDGTHIPIIRPVESSQDYRNYKMFFSLNVQAICDYRGLFLDVDCRWPGCVHDAKVLANSNVGKTLRTGSLPKTSQGFNFEKVPNYVIGDPAYPLTPYLMKEYEHCETNEEVIFNNVLRAARNPIECAFGRLKARWRFLKKDIDLNMKHIPTAVYACFILHNYCELKKSYVDPIDVDEQIEVIRANEREHENLPDPIYSCNLGEGEAVRRILTSNIAMNLPDHLI